MALEDSKTSEALAEIVRAHIDKRAGEFMPAPVELVVKEGSQQFDTGYVWCVRGGTTTVRCMVPGNFNLTGATGGVEHIILALPRNADEPAGDYIAIGMVWNGVSASRIPPIVVDSIEDSSGNDLKDHGSLSGLSDDDHSQYHTDARGDARYYTQGQLDGGQLDGQYFQESEHLNSSAGAGDSGKPIKLDAAGHIDASMINDADVDHGSTGGLSDDDHSQYGLLAGRSGGQTLIGGTASGEDLTLQSTAHATKGAIVLDDAIKLKASTILTLSTGAVTAVGPYHIMAAESGTTDDLDTITASDDRTLLVIQADAGDTITVKHGTGNIELNGAADFSLTGDATLLLFYDGTNWADMGAGGGGGGGADTALSNLAAVAINTSLISDTDNTDDLGSSAKKWKDLFALLAVLEERAAPGTPASGDVALYATDGLLYSKDDAGAETLVSGGAGSGGAISTTQQTIYTRVELHDETLGAAGSFDVSSISQDYEHLELALTSARGDIAATSDRVHIYLNNDTTDSNYRSLVHRAGLTHSATAASTPRIAQVPAATAGSNQIANIHMHIFEYTGSGNKQVDAVSSLRWTSTNEERWSSVVEWESTSAVNRIAIVTDNDPTDEFIAGTRLQIWGWKAVTVVTAVTGARAIWFTATADATVASTISETTILGTGEGDKTLTADTLVVGRTFRVRVRGHIGTKAASAGTINIKFKLGGAEVCSIGAQTVTDNLSDADFEIEAILTCRTIGASGTVVAGGKFIYDDGTEHGMVKTSTTTVDTTGSLALDVTATWGTADAGNTITAQIVTIEGLN